MADNFWKSYIPHLKGLVCDTKASSSQWHGLIFMPRYTNLNLALYLFRIGPEGYLCPSQVDYVKIHRALNVEGIWRVILQHFPHGYGHSYNYTQTTRLEACLTPESACRLLAPCYGSKCTQKYIYHRYVYWKVSNICYLFKIDIKWNQYCIILHLSKMYMHQKST